MSPFLPMGLDYELRYTAPGERLTLGLDVLRGGPAPPLRLPGPASPTAGSRRVGRLLWRHPAMTHRVTAGIYANAVRLRLKGAPVFANPVGRGRKPASVDAIRPDPLDATEIRQMSAPSEFTVCKDGGMPGAYR